jgi:hypothetical protein
VGVKNKEEENEHKQINTEILQNTQSCAGIWEREHRLIVNHKQTIKKTKKTSSEFERKKETRVPPLWSSLYICVSLFMCVERDENGLE